MSFLTDRASSTSGRRRAGLATLAIIASLGLGAGSAAAAPSLGVSLTHDDSEVQRVSVEATGGTFRLSYGGDTTTDLPASGVSETEGAAGMQAALNALPSISSGGGSVSVAAVIGGDGGPQYFITFDGGPLAHVDVPTMTASQGSAPLIGLSSRVSTETLHSAGVSFSDRRIDYRVKVTPSGVSGAVTLVLQLPAGQDVSFLSQSAVLSGDPTVGWDCTTTQSSGAQLATPTCTRSDVPAPGASYPTLLVIGRPGANTPADAVAVATVSGGGAAPATATDAYAYTPAQVFEISRFEARATDATGADDTTAGGHPFSANANFLFPRYRNLSGLLSVIPNSTAAYYYNPIEHLKDALTDLPRGFVGNPLAAPELCPGLDQVLTGSCPPGSAVGGVTLDLIGFGTGLGPLAVYAIKPEKGEPAEFAFAEGNSNTTYTLVPRLRADDGYAITLVANPVPLDPTTLGIEDVTLCSFGANTKRTTPPGFNGIQLLDGCKRADDADANPQPLITNPSYCAAQPPTTRLTVDSWEHPDVLRSKDFAAPALTGCDAVRFDPTAVLTPTSHDADAATGLDVGLSVPTDGLLQDDGIAQAHLKKAVVSLPEGIAVNPSGATGLEACTDDQLKLGTNDATACPDGSKIGTVEITTPILKEHLTGDVVLRTPTSTDPTSGGMFRLAIIVQSEERGILVKLPGSAVADPATGQLTATFDDNPQLPFSALKLNLKGGSRGILAMPQACGSISTTATLTPWSSAAPAVQATPVTVTGACAAGFAPKVDAGSSNRQAGGSGTFSFQFSRQDGEQWVNGLTAVLPTGLLADIKDVPLCTGAQADAGDCPAASRIGSVDASAGSGTPFTLEQKGSAYLTDGYKGCAYGLDVDIPVVAGPFRGAFQLGDVNVRQSLCVDPIDAHVTVTSDPLPTIWHGIPLRVRSVTVAVDRPGFMLNPTSCDAKAVTAALRSPQGVTAQVSSPFQVDGCAALALKPKLAISLTGKGQTTDDKHPGVAAVLTQPAGQANLKRVQVSLPLSLALDPDNAQALCEFTDGSKVDPVCPAGSIVGHASARTPILGQPLTGPVYFVKNVRTDAKTGRQIKTLPKLVIPLTGPNGLRINLVGTSGVVSNHLVTTFENIPDAPVSSFALNITGGKHGILVISGTDICKATQKATRQVDGQNGKTADATITLSTPCKLGVVASSHSSKSLSVTIGGVGGGKVVLSGKGIVTTSRTIADATTVTVQPRLTSSVRRTLARRHDVRLTVAVSYRPKGAKKARVAHKRLLIHGRPKTQRK
jgi:hypothetical protein